MARKDLIKLLDECAEAKAKVPTIIASARCQQPPFGCGGDANHFRDALSRKEYTISGLCQECQDDIFGADA